MTSEEFEKRLDLIVLELMHKANLVLYGKTISANSFPEARQSLRLLFLDAVGEDTPEPEVFGDGDDDWEEAHRTGENYTKQKLRSIINTNTREEEDRERN